MNVSTEDRTYQVRATNKSNKWSEWSPNSNSIRAFQPPGAPGNVQVVPTGVSNEVKVTFNAAAANGAKSSEISYRWSARGQSGTITSGGKIRNSSAFPNGSTVQVTITAISNVKGETATGGNGTASVNAYGKPSAPSVSASKVSNSTKIRLKWNSPASSNGRSISTMQVYTTDTGTNTKSRVGERDEGSGPNQKKCVKARVKNSEGVWSDWSATKCSTTKNRGTGRLYHGSTATCGPTLTGTCTYIEVKLRGWYPNKYVSCTLTGKKGEEKTVSRKVGGDGNLDYRFPDWVVEFRLYPDSGTAMNDCYYS